MYAKEEILRILKALPTVLSYTTNQYNSSAKTGILAEDAYVPENHVIAYNPVKIIVDDEPAFSVQRSWVGVDAPFNAVVIENQDNKICLAPIKYPPPQGMTGAWALSGNFGGCYFSLYQNQTDKSLVAAHEYAGASGTVRTDTGSLNLQEVASIKSTADTGDYGAMCVYGGQYMIAFATISGTGQIEGIGAYTSGNLPA